ncbi:MAG: hypothetical protein QN141_01220 [Armatimonadota bacterium]|nr:hypothetical protein [Armatimonadota bacterium]MDR7450957.1 hypothetical protein [Armatimonadota bacterium]MDR7465879.1 hypothetical protein [Armatimonadota bacterium]MDR7493787.1 hypothetical protein [Armatimonadota bacterium]MDR7498393.1 hypothetical protein [Armatimonadota bacterium]
MSFRALSAFAVALPGTRPSRGRAQPRWGFAARGAWERFADDRRLIGAKLLLLGLLVLVVVALEVPLQL